MDSSKTLLDSDDNSNKYLRLNAYSITKWKLLLSTNPECSPISYKVLDEQDRKFKSKEYDDTPSSKLVK